MQFASRAYSFAWPNAGSSKAARIAMIAITTSSSIRVNLRQQHASAGFVPGFVDGFSQPMNLAPQGGSGTKIIP
jgi:hypothetical protein